MSNNHLEPNIVEYDAKNPEGRVVATLKMSQAPNKGAEIFWAAAQEIGREAPAGWARCGSTGYLDQVNDRDLDEVAPIVWGRDAAGRRFVSFRISGSSMDYGVEEKSDRVVVTLFERYKDCPSLWVSGGTDAAGLPLLTGEIKDWAWKVLLTALVRDVARVGRRVLYKQTTGYLSPVVGVVEIHLS